MSESNCQVCGNRTGDPMEKGRIVQIVPSMETFGGCFAVIDEVCTWGIKAYMRAPGQDGLAWLRLDWEQFDLTGGIATWTHGEYEDCNDG